MIHFQLVSKVTNYRFWFVFVTRREGEQTLSAGVVPPGKYGGGGVTVCGSFAFVTVGELFQFLRNT